MSIVVKKLDQDLAELKRQYFATQDPQLQSQLNQQGNALRSQGASEAVANWLVTGDVEGVGKAAGEWYMGAEYDPQKDWSGATDQAVSMFPRPATTSGASGAFDLDRLQQAVSGLATPSTSLPSYTPVAASKVDTSPLAAAGPQQPITMPGVTKVEAPKRDLSALEARAADVPGVQLPGYQQQTPTQLDMTPLKQALDQQAPAPDAMESRFGTPEQFGAYVDQTRQMLQPATDAQKQAATYAFNQAMQKLGDQWAGRGMLASGAAAAQEGQAAAGFGIQMGLLEGQQLEQAINTALQMGQISMAEAQAIWNQKMAGAQFGQHQLQAQADNLARAMGMEMAQGQWGQEFNRAQMNDIFQQAVASHQLSEQQRQAAQQALTQLAQMDIQQQQFGAGMDVQQQQFGAQLNLAVQQAEAGRVQTLAQNLAQRIGMDVQQAQWGSEFNFQQEKEVFQRALASAQLDAQAKRDAQNALLRIAEMEQQQVQWEAGTMGTYQGELTMEGKKLQAALEASKVAADVDTWKAELAMEDAEFDRWLKTQKLNLDRAKHATVADYKAHLKERGLTEDNGKTATNKWIASVTAFDEPVGAFKLLASNAIEIADSGVNMTEVLRALRNVWPDFYTSSDTARILERLTQ